MADYTTSFRIEAEGLKNNLKMLSKKNQNTVLSIAQNFCKKRLEPYAKEHAPWRDRTGNARRGLNAKAELDGAIIKNIKVSLSHGVWYGYRLETWFNQRYQVIWPTIRDLSPELLRECAGYLNKIKL